MKFPASKSIIPLTLVTYIGVHGSSSLDPNSPPILLLLEAVHEDGMQQSVEHLL